jgi:hypothetical protein
LPSVMWIRNGTNGARRRSWTNSSARMGIPRK